MRTKQSLEILNEKEKNRKKLDFSFSLFYSLFFFCSYSFFILPLVAGFTTRLYLCSKSFPENAEEGKSYNKKWHCDRKTRFSFDFASQSDRFLVCKSGAIHEISPIWALFERFLPSA